MPRLSRPGASEPSLALETNRLSRPYRRQLKKARAWLRVWEIQKRIDLSTVTEPESLDSLLAAFVQDSRESAMAFWIPKLAVLHLQWLKPSLRRRLPRTWNCLKTWYQENVWAPRVPVTQIVMLNWFLTALDLVPYANARQAQLLVRGAILLRLGFYTMMRPGELLALMAKDFRCVSQSVGVFQGIVAIKSPKNKGFLGRA